MGEPEVWAISIQHSASLHESVAADYGISETRTLQEASIGGAKWRYREGAEVV